MTAQAAAVERFEPVAARGRFALSGAGVLSIAMVVAGGLTYVFQILAARALGPTGYGEIAVLWGALFLVTVVLFRPLEQTLSRSLADRLARGEEIRSPLRAVGRVFLALVVAGGLVFVLAWDAITDRLFAGNGVVTAMLAVGTFGYGLCYVARGAFGGSRWFGGYGLVLVADAAARVLLAIPLIVLASVNLAAAALALATFVGVAVPLREGRRRLRRGLDATTGPAFDMGAAVRFVAPATVIAAADQLLVNGAPVLVAIEGGSGASRAAGVVFAATMLVRVPVFLFQGLAASLLPNLTLLQASDEHRLLRRAVTRTSLCLLAASALIVGTAAAFGPPAMSLLFGSSFEAGRVELALLGAGVGFYLAAATVSQALLALDATGRAAVAWAASAVTFGCLFLVLPGDQLVRIATGFAFATLLACAALAGILASRLRAA
jgi:O-antigen/teichoic acid export membrane protein